MSRKDFILIAKTIYNSRLDIANKEYIARELADELRNTNDNFKYQLFVSACITGVMK